MINAPFNPSQHGSKTGQFDILVIEDQAEMRHALELALGHLGNICFSAGTLRDAKGILDAFVIDVIICDLHLPDGDGLTLRDDLRECFQRIPSILITADNDPFIARRSREAGYVACLRKPLELGELCEVIGRLRAQEA